MMFLRRNLTIFFLRSNNKNFSLRCFSAPGSQCPPQGDHHFMVEYLVNSCGLPTDKATRCARYISHLKSTRKPESVLGFFRAHGFNDAQIKKLVTSSPMLLCKSVEKSLEPKFKAMQDLGFTRQGLVRLMLSNPSVLRVRITKVQNIMDLWRGLAGTPTLPPDFFYKHRVFSGNFEKNILPNIQFLGSLGVSNDTLVKITRSRPEIIMRTPELIKKAAKQVVEMGLPSSSGTFAWAVVVVLSISEAKFKTNFEVLKNLGWSQSEIFSALCKNPTIITISEKVLRLKVDYLVKEVGLNPAYLICNPVLFGYSLDKRVIPRHKVIEILRSRGLRAQSVTAISYIPLSNKKFLGKFVLPYIDEAPELNEIYSSMQKGGKCF